MRILIACDSFKDALPADAVCEAVARGLARSHPDAELVRLPLSDGGEGALTVLAGPMGLTRVEARVSDPLMRPVTASYGLSTDGRTAVVEMAAASGLELLAQAERDPLRTSSFGVGQLLADARRRGAARIVLAIGGSATTDAGIGAAAALGWGFLDAAGAPVEPVGGRLQDIASLVPPDARPIARLDVLCDVTSPLFGSSGAAWVYGWQKGGSEAALAQLDAGLAHVAGLVEAQLGLRGLADTPGAGAAGGLGFGAMAFLRGELMSGVDLVLDLIDFDAQAAGADLIVTGEGRLDGQSAQGKLIQGLCRRAKGRPVVALCGEVSASAADLRRIGLRAAHAINAEILPLPQMLAATAANLERAAAAL